MSKEQYDELLTAYEQRLTSEVSASRLSGTEEFNINGRVVSISFAPDEAFPEEGKVICRTDFARVKQWPADALCRFLLQANNLWAGTQGSSIGLRGSDIITMSASRRIGSLSATTLDDMLKVLCADAEKWAGRLAARPKAEPAPMDFQNVLHMRA